MGLARRAEALLWRSRRFSTHASQGTARGSPSVSGLHWTRSQVAPSPTATSSSSATKGERAGLVRARRSAITGAIEGAGLGKDVLVDDRAATLRRYDGPRRSGHIAPEAVYGGLI